MPKPPTLVVQYERQHRFRDWDRALEKLPITKRQRVLDLGCGTGHVSERLRQLGADVIGLDLNDDLVKAARQNYPEVQFESCDLNTLNDPPGGMAGGVWASFVAAYFSDLEGMLRRWQHFLAPGGWIALIEMDDLFAHGPLPAPWPETLERFYADTRAQGGYDFECGRRLRAALSAAGYTIEHEGLLDDAELAFNGPARPDVLTSWQERLSRMTGLKRYLGDEFPAFHKAFLAALTAEAHVSRTRVFMVVGRAPA